LKASEINWNQPEADERDDVSTVVRLLIVRRFVPPTIIFPYAQYEERGMTNTVIPTKKARKIDSRFLNDRQLKPEVKRGLAITTRILLCNASAGSQALMNVT